MQSHLARCLLTFTFLLGLTSTALADTFTAIVVPGAALTNPSAIGPCGDIVGAYINPDDNEHGFLLSHGKYTTIDVPVAPHFTTARGINPQGDIVGHYTDVAGVDHGYLLTRNGQFTTIDPPDAISSNAVNIN